MAQRRLRQKSAVVVGPLCKKVFRRDSNGCESEKQSPVFFSCLASCGRNLMVEYQPSKLNV